MQTKAHQQSAVEYTYEKTNIRNCISHAATFPQTIVNTVLNATFRMLFLNKMSISATSVVKYLATKVS